MPFDEEREFGVVVLAEEGSGGERTKELGENVGREMQVIPVCFPGEGADAGFGFGSRGPFLS